MFKLKPAGVARSWPSVRGVLACVTAAGLLGVLTTPAVSWAGEEPVQRAYELVSPPVKNGGDVSSGSTRVRASSDGSGVVFVSPAGFGDVHGSGIAVEYLSKREPAKGTNGWQTHAITPAQGPLSYDAVLQSLEPGYQGELSPDLSTGVYRSWSALSTGFAMDNVSKVANLYVRNDIQNSGQGSYDLMSGCPLCEATGEPLPPLIAVGSPLPILVGTSSDFTHVAFESKLNLTEDAPPQPTGCATNIGACNTRLYESDHGVVRLVGILPNGTASAVSITATGGGASRVSSEYTPHVVSNDGRRIEFTRPTTETHPETLEPTGFSGQLFQRVEGSSTVQLNASERTDCADHDPCNGTPEPDLTGTFAATYEDASADGTRVWFVTRQALTNDASIGSTGKLYMWDANSEEGHHLTLISADHEPADGSDVEVDNRNGVLGVSEDGHYVYFTADGQLVAHAPVLHASRGLYVWHDETGTPTVDYIGELANGFGDGLLLIQTSNWVLSPKESRVMPDGRHLLFVSSSGKGLLSAHGGTDVDQSACPGGCRTLYLYSADTHSLQCASCAADGTVSAQAEDIALAKESATPSSPHLNRALSDNGQHVFFNTAGALVPGDDNDTTDAYEFDAASGTVRLLSSGTDPSPSYFMDASSSGSDAFFTTRQQLVGWDKDQNYDLYDARVGGGIAEPPSVLPGCAGSSCQGALGGAPALSVPGSFAFTGAGNLAVTSLTNKSVGLTSKQKLARALRVCRKRSGRVRKRCEARARKQYAGKASKNRRSK